MLCKWAKPDLSNLENDIFEWFNKMHLLKVNQYHPQEAVCENNKKVK